MVVTLNPSPTAGHAGAVHPDPHRRRGRALPQRQHAPLDVDALRPGARAPGGGLYYGRCGTVWGLGWGLGLGPASWQVRHISRI